MLVWWKHWKRVNFMFYIAIFSHAEAVCGAIVLLFSFFWVRGASTCCQQVEVVNKNQSGGRNSNCLTWFYSWLKVNLINLIKREWLSSNAEVKLLPKFHLSVCELELLPNPSIERQRQTLASATETQDGFDPPNETNLQPSDEWNVFEIDQDSFADSPEIHKYLPAALQHSVSGALTTFRCFPT